MKTGTIVITAFPKPKRPIPEREWQSKAIAIASKIACLLAKGICQYCGKNHGKLYSHHIIHRTYASVSAEIRNLYPVAITCHSRIHLDEEGFKHRLESEQPGLYSELKQEAMQTLIISWRDVYETLLEKYFKLLNK